jgi:hypothetical protein
MEVARWFSMLIWRLVVNMLADQTHWATWMVHSSKVEADQPLNVKMLVGDDRESCSRDSMNLENKATGCSLSVVYVVAFDHFRIQHT